MTISFRTRLFVIAVLIVAVVLSAVMFLGWSRLLVIDLERLDDRLCLEARRLAAPPPRAERMPGLEADLADKLRLGSAAQLMLRFDSIDGVRSVQSTHWEPALEADTLKWTTAPRQPEPPPLGRRDGPRDGLRERPRDGPAGGPPQDGPERFEASDRPPRGTCSLAAFIDQGREWRAARFSLPFGRSTVAVDLAATKAELQGAMKRALTIVIPLALVLTALGAWLLASLTMRPVNRLRDAMKGVTQKALDRRLSSQGEDREFAELIDAYNTMLARLEASFHQASRFSADAAHELKTPLTILQGRIEQAVNNSDRRAIQTDLTEMQDEVGRLTAITRKLLLLSQADAGRLALQLTRIDLSELLDSLMADAQMLVGDQKVITAIERELVTDGDAVLLRQLFNNLLSNAVRYCPGGGWIKVTARRLPEGFDVTFANASRTIGREDRQRFFDRFYRGDAAHNRHIDGNGLGLSLAREIARAHGGELTLEASAQNEVALRLWLPHSAMRSMTKM